MRTCASLVIAAVALASAPCPAAAMCRIVEEPDSVPPSVDPKQAVLFTVHDDLSIGCDDGDAGVLDGGLLDGGADADGGTPDGGASDAGAGDAGASDGGAQCQYIGEAITMTVQPRLTIGDSGARFAMLMVTPELPHIRLAPIDLFARLADSTAPIVFADVEYVEDASLGYQCKDPQFGGSGCGGTYVGGGGGGNFPPPPDPNWTDPDGGVLETIGPYQVVRIDATTRDELIGWLDSFGYVYDDNDLDAVTPYIELGFVVTAVRVRTDVQFAGALQPLAFTYPGTEVRMPLGISRQTEPSETHIATYVIADGRYDFPGATPFFADYHPTEPDLFITRANLSRSLTLGADDDPIAVPIAANPTYHATVTVDQTVRIPSSQCPDNGSRDDYGCWCDANSGPSTGGFALFLLTAAGLALLFRRRRRGATLRG